MLVVTFNANFKGLEMGNVLSFKLFYYSQWILAFLFLIDSIIGEVFGCSDFYNSLYSFNSEDKREKL